MSSSSDDETYVPKVVRKRKRRRNSKIETTDINLYHHSVIPKVEDIKRTEINLDETDRKRSKLNESNKSPQRELRSKSSGVPVPSQTNNDVILVNDQLDNSNNLPSPPSMPSTQNKRLRQKVSKLKNTMSSELQKLSSTDKNDNIQCPSPSPVKYEKTMFVKIRLKGVVSKYPLKLSEPFEMVLKNIGLRNNVSINRVLMTKGDTRVTDEHTPKSLKLNVADILECVILEKVLQSDKKTITLQMQCNFRREKVGYSTFENEALKEVMEKYAQHIECNVKELNFIIDGESISADSTPASLDLTDGDCIDVMKRKKK